MAKTTKKTAGKTAPKRASGAAPKRRAPGHNDKKARAAIKALRGLIGEMTLPSNCDRHVAALDAAIADFDS